MTKENTLLATSSEGQRDRPNINYSFPFMKDVRLVNHPNRIILAELAGPNNTIPHVELVIKELCINQRLSVARVMPSLDQQWRIIPETGIACRSTSGDSVELLFDPDNPNVIDSLQRWSGRQIAHELNHIARITQYPLHVTLLDALISEGLATYHEEHWQNVYSESHWGHVLSEEQLRLEWSMAQNGLDSTNYDFADWFYGRKQGHPIYTGYSLGLAIVASFFKDNKNLQMADVVKMPSAEILNLSDFIQ